VCTYCGKGDPPALRPCVGVRENGVPCEAAVHFICLGGIPIDANGALVQDSERPCLCPAHYKEAQDLYCQRTAAAAAPPATPAGRFSAAGGGSIGGGGGAGGRGGGAGGRGGGASG
jgi:hypothetical protein